MRLSRLGSGEVPYTLIDDTVIDDTIKTIARGIISAGGPGVYRACRQSFDYIDAWA